MLLFSAIFLLFSSLSLQAAMLRLEEGKAWLKVSGEPLSKVLYLFEECGVRVLLDPALDLGRVNGEWENTKVERLIDQLISPNNYSLEWKRIKSPLGDLYQIAVLRVFSDHASSVRPLSEEGRTLNVIEGENGTRYIRGEIMIGFKEGASIKDLKALLKMLNGTVIEVLDPPGVYRIKLNEGLSVEDAVIMAKAYKAVKEAEPNLAFPKFDVPAVNLDGTTTGINLSLLPGETAIAVFDSGLNPQYADLPLIRGTYNALDPSVKAADPTGHGTLVSLIASGAITPIGAEASDTGVPVLAVRVFDKNGMTSSDTIMRAFSYALNSGTEVINMSFGTYEEIGFIDRVISYAAQQGIKIFVAAGNDGIEGSANPAANPYTVSVGAERADGTKALYSNWGRDVDIMEPGSIRHNGKFRQGTSFASPYAAHKHARDHSSSK